MEQNQSRDLPPEENTDRQAPLFPGGEADGAPGQAPSGAANCPVRSAAWSQSRGCKGRSPLHKIAKISPFPAGEGGRGDGAKESHTGAGKTAGRENRQRTKKQRLQRKNFQNPLTNREKCGILPLQ